MISKNKGQLLCFLIGMFFLSWALVPALGFCDTCTDLKNGSFGAGVVIDSAVVKSSPIQNCQVDGHIGAIDFQFRVSLPMPSTAWNQRLYVVGNGGAAGSIQSYPLDKLAQGYAIAGGNGGHIGVGTYNYTFADPNSNYNFPTPNPPYDPGPKEAQALRRYILYATSSQHEFTGPTKEIIKAFYGSYPHYSYFVGCSNGGRQAWAQAQQFPGDFDGILGGAPAFSGRLAVVSKVWNALAQLGDGHIVRAKIPTLAAAVFKKCDGIDGLVDGVIDDPRNCMFDPMKDLPICPEGADPNTPTCFTVGQINALKKIYAGPAFSNGVKVTPGYPFGGEALAPATGGAQPILVGFLDDPGTSTSLTGVSGTLQSLAFDPPRTNFDWRTFNVDEHYPLMTKLDEFQSKLNPNLSGMKARGAKIIHYHGWNDPLQNANFSIDYYESVVNFMGGEDQIKNFYKFYVIPEMAHCAQAASCQPDFFPALVNWIENGVAPKAVIGTRPASSDPLLNWSVRTRPNCPYPEVARYLGNGSIESAENFTCVETIPAEVRIEPETLNLKSKGEFTAFITIPDGYKVRNWDAAVCEGAPAVKGTFSKNGQTYVAKFNRQDLINITAGEEVLFTVTAIFEYKGEKVALEGTYPVRVIK